MHNDPLVTEWFEVRDRQQQRLKCRVSIDRQKFDAALHTLNLLDPERLIGLVLKRTLLTYGTADRELSTVTINPYRIVRHYVKRRCVDLTAAVVRLIAHETRHIWQGWYHRRRVILSHYLGPLSWYVLALAFVKGIRLFLNPVLCQIPYLSSVFRFSQSLNPTWAWVIESFGYVTLGIGIFLLHWGFWGWAERDARRFADQAVNDLRWMEIVTVELRPIEPTGS